MNNLTVVPFVLENDLFFVLSDLAKKENLTIQELLVKKIVPYWLWRDFEVESKDD